MSRIGKMPVVVPSGVKVDLDGQKIMVKGPKGELGMTIVDEVHAVLDESLIVLKPKKESKSSLSMWGMQRTLVNNLIIGVTQGFSKVLEIVGVGYRAQMQGKDLLLNLGFSHEVRFPVPEGISISVEGQNQVTISGSNKQKVGQVAAEIRSIRPPEPYKGKGVKYSDEYVVRKEGKKK